jgi:hypothetical protein
MPENENQPSETPAPEGQNQQPQSDPQVGKDGQPFDAARAMSTIEALRAEIKSLKGTSKELEAARAKLKEIEDAGKSEAERATTRAAEEEQKRVAAEQRAQDLLIRLSVERAAGKLGFHDTDDAYRLIDRKAVELDDDGEPTNVEKLLADLAKAKPHLVKSEDGEKPTRTATRSVPATPKPSGQPQTPQERVKHFEQKLAGSGRYAPL